jgi:hypothetical protein
VLMALFYAALASALRYSIATKRAAYGYHMQGFLSFIAGVCGVVAAVSYGALCRRLSLRSLLVLCMTAGTVANLGYLLYSSWERAQLIDGLNGFGYTLAELALMDLAVRATPAGSEGLGFALMVSIRNFALFGTDWFGSKLLDSYHISFSWLVLANAATTAFTVPLAFLLPASLVALRDGERLQGILASTPVSSLEDEKE